MSNYRDNTMIIKEIHQNDDPNIAIAMNPSAAPASPDVLDLLDDADDADLDLEPIAPNTQAPQGTRARRARCPKGTRRNKKGVCVPYNPPAKVAHVAAALSDDDEVVPEPGRMEEQRTIRIVDPSPVAQQQEQSGDAHANAKTDEPGHQGEEDASYPGLYPVVGDPNFNEIITKKKEFHEIRYDRMDKFEIAEYAAKMCDAPDFELAPHQLFIRNFMSVMTPYNSLLLYHGLGTGKTCSAISVAEEMRDYLKQMGIQKRILVVASPNVQDNFRLQLFDEGKLKQTDGLWDLRACTGKKYIKEINPLNMRDMSREAIVRQINAIINKSYKFAGYIQLGTIIYETITGQKKQTAAAAAPQHRPPNGPKKNLIPRIDPETLDAVQIRRIQTKFNNTLIVIDEVHNLRVTEDAATDDDAKRTAALLFVIAKHAQNLRFLLLSGTPMFDSPKEIVWLLNLMNTNDNRSTFEIKDAFLPDGNIRTTPSGYSIGKEIIKRKSYGYISHVRGENPFTFPYRIYPRVHSPESAISAFVYPSIRYDGVDISPRQLNFIDAYVTPIGSVQSELYQICVDRITRLGDAAPMAAFTAGTDSAAPAGAAAGAAASAAELLDVETDTDSENSTGGDTGGLNFGFQSRRALQALTIVFPCDADAARKNASLIFVGEAGLSRVMDERADAKAGTITYSYKPEVERIFAPDHIGKYSNKIASICGHISRCTGIVLVYSEYIKGGAVPMALALEEMGYTRYRMPNLLTGRAAAAATAATASGASSYIIISGNKLLSPNTPSDIKAATNPNNKDGSLIKVVIITKAGSEGLDLKNVRQVHIIDPWYNLNLLEQIVGRAVRNCSHRDLGFKFRNVSIFMHGTMLVGPASTAQTEALDLCMYRYAEEKAVKIGNVTRILKKHAIDCNLNSEYNHLALKNGTATVEQVLSNGQTVEHNVEPKPYSDLCDYQADCDTRCEPMVDTGAADININTDTYDASFLTLNSERIIQRIRELFKERFFYTATELVQNINIVKTYPEAQIYMAINTLIDDPIEFISDHYGRTGRLINIGDYFLFQPADIDNPQISIRERAMPLDESVDYVTYMQKKDDPILEAVPETANIGLKSFREHHHMASAHPVHPVHPVHPMMPAHDKDPSLVSTSVREEPSSLPSLPSSTSRELQIIGDLETKFRNSLFYNKVIRKETKVAAAAAAAAAKMQHKKYDDFNKFSGAIIADKLTATALGGVFERGKLEQAVLAHYLDTLSFDDGLTLVNYVRAHPTRPMDDPPASGRNMRLEEIIYHYYKRKIISCTSNPSKCAIILNHDSISKWDGNADASSSNSADSLFAFIVLNDRRGGVAGLGAAGQKRWAPARQDDQDDFRNDIFAYVAKLRSGVFGRVARPLLQSQDPIRYIGFQEYSDREASYKFKTLRVNIGSGDAAGTSMRGRICANDTDKATNINPMVISLLRLRMKRPTDAELIDAFVNDKLDSVCVLTELVLRYYDYDDDAVAIGAADAGALAASVTRWHLAPCEMQLLTIHMNYLKTKRAGQLKAKM